MTPTISNTVFPACAGMILLVSIFCEVQMGVPRMRGDDPLRRPIRCPPKFVFPACAGMIPSEEVERAAHGGVPRMRGDDPSSNTPIFIKVRCSPHARG